MAIVSMEEKQILARLQEYSKPFRSTLFKFWSESCLRLLSRFVGVHQSLMEGWP